MNNTVNSINNKAIIKMANKNIPAQNAAPAAKKAETKSTLSKKEMYMQIEMNRRINSFKRKCKQYGLSDEDTKKKVEEYKKELAKESSYDVLILFDIKNKLCKESIMNSKIKYKYITDSHCWLEGNRDTLNKIYEVIPEGCKVYPYRKPIKKPSIIVEDANKKLSNNSKEKASLAKEDRKEAQFARHSMKPYYAALRRGHVSKRIIMHNPKLAEDIERWIESYEKKKSEKKSRPNKGTNRSVRKKLSKMKSKKTTLALTKEIKRYKAVA